jgi:uncharacterized protein (DUF433 family)
MNYNQYITISSDVRSGKPVIKGSRITVTDVLEYLASGMAPSDIQQDFPELSPPQIQACLLFAANRERMIHHRAQP